MRAIGNYLVIEEIKEKATKTKGGLLLTDKIKEDIRYRQGVVKSVGDLIQGVKADDKIYKTIKAACAAAALVMAILINFGVEADRSWSMTKSPHQ